jgi:hypothetical protein
VALRDALVLRLRDELFLLRVGSRHVKRHDFTRSEDSIGHQHAEFPHEDSSTFDVEEYPKRGHEMYYTSHGDEIGDGILSTRFCAAHRTLIFRATVFANEGFPLRGFTPPNVPKR